MAVKEVTQLRNEGRLKEAFDLALTDLRDDPNEWSRMAMFWVLRDIVQNRCIPNRNMEQARSYLTRMKALLPGMKDDNDAGQNAYNRLLKSLVPDADMIKRACELSKTDPTAAYNQIVAKTGPSGNNKDVSLHEDFGWIIYRYIKANIGNLTSLQVRSLLRDYMMLKNERPSMLHSVMLNFALNFTKDHPDFSFFRFFLLWGAGNLRSEDWQKGIVNGHEIPSLVERICREIGASEKQIDIQDFVSQFGERRTVVIEYLRQSYFWKLMDWQKEKKWEKLWPGFDDYAATYSVLGPSQWHSEILKIAYRFMSGKEAYRFLSFMIQWYGKGNLSPDDWKKGNSAEEIEYPSLAVKSAKRCFEIIKEDPQRKKDPGLIHWLKTLYTQIIEQDSADDWSIRNYARICIWEGSVEEAISTYKKLLLHKNGQYYLWSELADCVSDSVLQTGLLLKAKSLEKNEDYLGDIHLVLARNWLQEGAKEKARQELEIYAKHRKLKGWGISNDYQKLMDESRSIENGNLQVDPFVYIRNAEDFAYSEAPTQNFVLTEKWTDNEGMEHGNFYDGSKLIFSIPTKRFAIPRNCKPGTIFQVRYYVPQREAAKTEMFIQSKLPQLTAAKPLILRKTDLAPWSILPIKYAIVDYINEQKQMLHILTQDSIQAFYPNVDPIIKKDTFVKFREFIKYRKDRQEIGIAEVCTCSPEEALTNMSSQIAVVDDVNEAKQLFHIVLEMGKICDIVKFEQTRLRPAVGDLVRIIFFIKQNKEGKKHIKLLDIQPTEEENCHLRKTINGRLIIKYKHNNNFFYDEGDMDCEPDFAFINNIYVHRSILRKYHIKKDCNVTAQLVLSGNNTWKVYDLKI